MLEYLAAVTLLSHDTVPVFGHAAAMLSQLAHLTGLVDAHEKWAVKSNVSRDFQAQDFHDLMAVCAQLQEFVVQPEGAEDQDGEDWEGGAAPGSPESSPWSAGARFAGLAPQQDPVSPFAPAGRTKEPPPPGATAAGEAGPTTTSENKAESDLSEAYADAAAAVAFARPLSIATAGDNDGDSGGDDTSARRPLLEVAISVTPVARELQGGGTKVDDVLGLDVDRPGGTLLAELVVPSAQSQVASEASGRAGATDALIDVPLPAQPAQPAAKATGTAPNPPKTGFLGGGSKSNVFGQQQGLEVFAKATHLDNVGGVNVGLGVSQGVDLVGNSVDYATKKASRTVGHAAAKVGVEVEKGVAGVGGGSWGPFAARLGTGALVVAGKLVAVDRLVEALREGDLYRGHLPGGLTGREGRADAEDPSAPFFASTAKRQGASVLSVPVALRQNTLRAMNLHATLFDALDVDYNLAFLSGEGELCCVGGRHMHCGRWKGIVVKVIHWQGV